MNSVGINAKFWALAICLFSITGFISTVALAGVSGPNSCEFAFYEPAHPVSNPFFENRDRLDAKSLNHLQELFASRDPDRYEKGARFFILKQLEALGLAGDSKLIQKLESLKITYGDETAFRADEIKIILPESLRETAVPGFILAHELQHNIQRYKFNPNSRYLVNVLKNAQALLVHDVLYRNEYEAMLSEKAFLDLLSADDIYKTRDAIEGSKLKGHLKYFLMTSLRQVKQPWENYLETQFWDLARYEPEMMKTEVNVNRFKFASYSFMFGGTCMAYMFPETLRSLFGL
jgi:hypothetical protein